MTPGLILYDGTCGFCSRSVRFILNRDPEGRFHFSANDTPFAVNLLKNHGLNRADIDSIVLIANGRAFTESDAALEIARQLKSPVRFLAVFRPLPKKWRNGVYRLVAGNRYRLGGKNTACLRPSPEERDRFIF